MNELLEQLREGRFTIDDHRLTLENGKQLWTANKTYGINLYPFGGADFSWCERRAIAKAIKEGRMKQTVESKFAEIKKAL